MRHNIIIIAACLLSALGAAAQESYSTGDFHVTVEAGTGITGLQANMKQFTKNKIASMLYAEARYRLAKVPIDFGVYASYDVVARDCKYECEFTSASSTVMLTADYNWRVGKSVTAFAGCGVGMASFEWNDQVIVSDEEGPVFLSNGGPEHSFAFMPRVGITAFNVLRLTAGYKFEERANRHAFVTIGFTFGMGRIKR
jgi:opacity protein-like surface antigen